MLRKNRYMEAAWSQVHTRVKPLSQLAPDRFKTLCDRKFSNLYVLSLLLHNASHLLYAIKWSHQVASDFLRGLSQFSQLFKGPFTTLQDHMRHILEHSHGRATHAYKGANHLASLEIRATLLRVNTMLSNVVRMFVRTNATI